MKNVHNGFGVKNMSDLVLKEIYSIHKTKDLRKKKVRKYEMTEREIFKKYNNLSEDELSKKSNKNVYMKNDVMSTIIKRCRGEKKGKRKTDGFRKKMMIPESEISEYPEHKVKSKLGNIFVNEKIFEEYSVKIYEIFMSIFMSITEKKYKLMKMGGNINYLELTFIVLNIS